ncbi:MAG TPA: nicotinate-nucleotide--dimethylbenzimidazole phosphoribosyltransferase [Ghiorsea sp.]|nr:nicotinate-nucleotide--dimethylbenzimidazole phosphoribosyltransferase [Ghiorsea sp.]HIP06611.1 nicotinate-nucleotide--dimethylbenzimidazole phosphoribosyltransferase [Mariprofundaceae bacterium]
MSIKTASSSIAHQARAHQNSLTKPTGSLGRLEDIACWFAARQGKVIPDLLNPHITVFAADHGVTAEGISAFPSVVTGEMVKNFATGGAAINVLAKQINASLHIVDVGVLVDTSNIQGVTQAKTQTGTANILYEAAMSDAACQRAIQAGKKEASLAITQGKNLLIAGDMGIGNTTASAALICLFSKATPEQVVGKGTGIDAKTHAHKMHIVQQIIHRVTTQNTPQEYFLREVGGFEIAAMAGFYLEAAEQGVPIIIDGFISAAAALAAQLIAPDVHQWMLASHLSEENGHHLALQYLSLEPLLDFHMRLGEGSGAALITPLLQSAIALHQNMATFASASISEKTSDT